MTNCDWCRCAFRYVYKIHKYLGVKRVKGMIFFVLGIRKYMSRFLIFEFHVLLQLLIHYWKCRYTRKRKNIYVHQYWKRNENLFTESLMNMNEWYWWGFCMWCIYFAFNKLFNIKKNQFITCLWKVIFNIDIALLEI
jgi:hypothetical protein